MNFAKYQHIERFGTIETEGIEIGTCHVFPKIDGTNASVWLGDDMEIHCGSRRRHLAFDDDNAGFMAWAAAHCDALRALLMMHPDVRLFGEWLVPHSLKTYRADAWRRFYVFDVCRDLPDGSLEYLPYDDYTAMLEDQGIDFIPCIGVVKNGDYETFVRQLDRTEFLVEDGQGVGEGIVIKNYAYKNKFGRTTWAKIVRSEFKEKHAKAMGPTELSAKTDVEGHIVEDFCTVALIEKTHAKIVAECEGWSSSDIPRLLNTVYHDLVQEECWNIVKKYKSPMVNFKRLQSMIVVKIKETMPKLF